MDSCVHQKRKAKVKEWIETLRTACPYRMNDKANDKRRPIGRLIGSKVNILERWIEDVINDEIDKLH